MMDAVTLTKSITLTPKQLAVLRRLAERPEIGWHVVDKCWRRSGLTTDQIGMNNTSIFSEWGLIKPSNTLYYWKITDKGLALFDDLNIQPLPQYPPRWLFPSMATQETAS